MNGEKTQGLPSKYKLATTHDTAVWLSALMAEARLETPWCIELRELLARLATHIEQAVPEVKDGGTDNITDTQENNR